MAENWTRRSLLAAGGASLASWPLLAAVPAAGSFDPAGIAALNRRMHALVDEQRLAGVVTLLAHRGQIVNFDAYGRQDVSQPAPMRLDTIVRLASMTKPVIGTAMLQLRGRGLWDLDDPVARHIPEFAGLKVRTADGGLVDQVSPMTMRQLMSHMAGFDGFLFYQQQGAVNGDLRDMIAKVATLPLLYQPGTDWVYGPAVDIQGYLVEKLSGMSLDAYLQRNIFDPLRMPDTQFWVDPAKIGRAAQLHAYRDGRIVPAAAALAIPTAPPRYLSGGGGLFGTANDYFRFAQALLDGGQLGGTRILGEASVRLMQTNVLPAGMRVKVGTAPDNGLGFGMDVTIMERPEATRSPVPKGSYWWMGAHATHFWIDPANQIVFVGLVQNFLGFYPGSETPDLRNIWPEAVYAAYRA